MRMKRLCLIAIISSLLLLAIPINSAYAASVFTIGSTQYANDGQTVQMDAAPYIEDNRTFLPVRFVANALGVPDSNIDYTPKTQEVELFKGNSGIGLLIGNTTMYVATSQGSEINVTKITMDVAPVLIAGHVYLPIAWIAQAFGVSATWDAASQTITLDDNSSSQQATTPSSQAAPSVTMTTFNVTPGTINMVAGTSAQLTATATMSDGSTSDITNTASYSSSNTYVATVSPTGLITCLAQGTATITVTDSGLTANVPVTVNAQGGESDLQKSLEGFIGSLGGTYVPFATQPAPQVLPDIVTKTMETVTLSNGTEWQICPLDQPDASSWVPMNRIEVTQNSDSLAYLFPYVLINTNAFGIDVSARVSYLGVVNLNQ